MQKKKQICEREHNVIINIIRFYFSFSDFFPGVLLMQNLYMCKISLMLLILYFCLLSPLDETPKPPVVFKMAQCNSSTDSLILGCLASEFSPNNSVNFKWSSNGKEITNVIQHSTSAKLQFSYITITKEQRDQSKITCTADHSQNAVMETFSQGNDRH